MTPLVDEPTVVILAEKKVVTAPKDGITLMEDINLSVATNISPNTRIVYCETKADFDRARRGLPFANIA